ncbi:ATP-grasp domain-containing protein [Candidatus Dependentiae bacterium]|nr:ATP-grasp domain-containing protein [Candidatus Dependentiae bacterium]
MKENDNDNKIKLSDNAKIGIINRGECAMRFIRGVKEYNKTFGTSLKTVTFYLDSDKDAPYVKYSDYCYPLKNINMFFQIKGNVYINRPFMLKALEISGCQGVWVGWGFLSEDSEFAAMIEKSGMVLLGPSSEAMALLGDKIKAKNLAEQSNVSICNWSKGPVKSVEEAYEIAELIGYPVIIKAANAGGGRGIRFVMNKEELERQYISAKEETIRITGGDLLYIEHFVKFGRHLEVQIASDRFGNVYAFGVRDCSVQRKNQKILEETPPTDISELTINEMQDSAKRLIKAAKYQGVGTVEFIFDISSQKYYFMEVNTRLQVEHTVTEQLYNIDLVKIQIQIASNIELSIPVFSPKIHVIEARLNAEDPENNFAPAPGKVVAFNIPSGPGIRVDSGIEKGTSIPQEFDSMIAKIISSGSTRNEAFARLERALEEFQILIEGGTTNKAFLIELLNNPGIKKGGVSTRYVEDMLSSTPDVIKRFDWQIALLACAIEQYATKYIEELTNFKQQFNRSGYPQNLDMALGHQISITHNSITYDFFVKFVGEDIFHIKINGQFIIVKYVWEESIAVLYYNEKRYRIQTVTRGNTIIFEINGTPYPIPIESGGLVKSQSPAMVIFIPVKLGQEIKKGQLLLSLEAMKMETTVTSQEDGIIKEIYVRQGEQIAAGQPLIKIEQMKSSSIKNSESEYEKIDFNNMAIDFNDVSSKNLFVIWNFIKREFEAVFLGFDNKEKTTDTLNRTLDFIERHPHFKNHLIELFLTCIEMYLDIESLFSNNAICTDNSAGTISFQELMMHYFKRTKDREKGMPEEFLTMLNKATSWYKSGKLHEIENYTRAMFRIYKTHFYIKIKNELLHQMLIIMQDNLNPADVAFTSDKLSDLLEKTAQLTSLLHPNIANAALNAQYILINNYLLLKIKETKSALIAELIKSFKNTEHYFAKQEYYTGIICNLGTEIIPFLLKLSTDDSEFDSEEINLIGNELLSKRFNRDRHIIEAENLKINSTNVYRLILTEHQSDKKIEYLLTSTKDINCLKQILSDISKFFNGKNIIPEITILAGELKNNCDYKQLLDSEISKINMNPGSFITIGLFYSDNQNNFYSYYYNDKSVPEEKLIFRDFSPLQIREFRLKRFVNFEFESVYKSESVFLVNAKNINNKKDERLFAFVETPETKPEFREDGSILRILSFENSFMEAVFAIRSVQSKRKNLLLWNRIIIHIHSVLQTTLKQIEKYAGYLSPRLSGLGLEKIMIYARTPGEKEKNTNEIEFVFENISGTQFNFRPRIPIDYPLVEINDYAIKVIKARQRGCSYPYEIIKMLTRSSGSSMTTTDKLPRGEFEEFDLDSKNLKLISVKNREYGMNSCNIISGIITNYIPNYEYPFKRVIILSDPTVDMGSLAEQECRRIIESINLAEQLKIPVEWIPVSAGARIDIDSGTENLDWTAAVLKRIIDFTQSGGEINIIVDSVNVGAQSYWNAEATMLMHTSGILIMTEESAMLLTGKKALDYAGSVSAENNVGIGGADKIMGPNGQAQFKTKDISSAYQILFKHYEFTYNPSENKIPIQHKTSDSENRNICLTPYTDNLNQNFKTIGDILDLKTNPERKKPFDMRQIMQAVIDTDSGYLERWAFMKDAETSIVWESRIGGFSSGILGIESKQISRVGEIPNDGPEMWTGGTLFPLSSKKIARAINSFSGKIPLVVLANLSGFDGSPESMRRLQLEYGAEIGRAVVNFKGPIVFVVIARYHGGAYVVFSKQLNKNINAAAVKGAYASVIGGSSAAAVVFPKLVIKNTLSDSRIIEAQNLLNLKKIKKKEYDEIYKKVFTEKQTELAQKFDNIHSIERAKSVGSIDTIILPEELRTFIINSIKKTNYIGI